MKSGYVKTLSYRSSTVPSRQRGSEECLQEQYLIGGFAVRVLVYGYEQGLRWRVCGWTLDS